MRDSGIAVLAGVFAALGVMGCEPATERPAAVPEVTFDTTESGVVHARYGAIPTEPTHELDVAFEVGTGSDVVFGDVRGIALEPDETVLVLDHQASELYRFDTTGALIEVVGTSGEGPREIASANGVHVDAEGAIWLNDHGRNALTRWLPDGGFETHPSFVNGYSYLWDGRVTDDGRIWVQWRHADDSFGPAGAQEPGLVTGTLRSYYKRMEPSTGTVDSVLVGPEPVRGLRFERGTANVPFSPERLQTVDPRGSIWTAVSDAYRLVRLTPDGDTTVVVDIAAEPPPIGEDERREAIGRVEEFMERAGRISVDWDEVLPDRAPVLEHLTVDEQGNVWVQRKGEPGPVFEVFAPDGRFLGQYRAGYAAFEGVPPVVRDGWLLAVQADSLDVQSVVGVRLPR
ncbi:MAG: 6-bladed beta-propeller [Gemmatimonadota bacterium]|nr:6-bladed beta-propeller [Gemmatimonadota bacterium]